MTMEEKRIELLELAVLDCLNILEDPTANKCRVQELFHTLEVVVGTNNQHLQSRAAKQRVKGPKAIAEP